MYETGKDNVYINDRKGFIKYALKNGYDVIPCYLFNEHQLFNTYSPSLIKKLFFILNNKFKIPLKFYTSKYLNIVLPNDDTKLLTVIGKKISMPKIIKPTKEEINKYH